MAERPTFIDLATDVLAPSAVRILPKAVWKRLRAVGVTRAEGMLIVAMADPDDRKALEELRIRTGLRIFATRAAEQEIDAALERSYDD